MMLSILEPARSTDLLRASIVRVDVFFEWVVTRTLIFLAVTVIGAVPEVVDPIDRVATRRNVATALLQAQCGGSAELADK